MLEILQVFALVLSSIFALILAFLSWKKRPSISSYALTFVMFFVFLWSFSEMMYFVFYDIGIKLFFDRLKYVSISMVPVSLFALAVNHIHHRRVINIANIVEISIIPIFTIIFSFTNDYHHFMKYDIRTVSTEMFSYFDCKFGFWFWIHTSYSYILTFIVFGLLIKEYFKAEDYYKRQSLIFVSSLIIPFIINIISLYKTFDGLYVDFTPVSFVISGLLMFYGIFRADMLNIMPIAKDQMLDSIDDLIIVVDNTNTIIYTNKMALEMLSQLYSNVLGHPLDKFINKMIEKTKQNLIEIKRTGKLSFKYRGQIRSFKYRENHILDSSKEIIGKIYIFSDITDFENLLNELQLEKEKANEASNAKSMFLANMNHEIRTPLNGIIGMTEYLLESEIDEEKISDLKIIKKSADKLLNVVTDVLDFSKLESQEIEIETSEFNLEKLASETFNFFNESKNNDKVKFIYNFDRNIPTNIVGDSFRVRQIMYNLLSNSVKFTHEGYIKLDISLKNRSEEYCYITISVSDSGIGIPEDKIDSLFNKFEQIDSSTTRRYGGTGLGLAITKNLIDLIGGHITVSSTINEGSTFEVLLNLKYSKEAEEEKSDSFEKEFQSKKIKILLAEDSKTNQIIITKLLKNDNWTIDVANNGLEALNMIIKDRYDIVLTDITMPEMDGYDLARSIRKLDTQRDLHTPIIAITAHTETKTFKKCVEAGIDDFISKPINKQKVLELMSKYVS